jgi:hypothetical protein
MKALNCRLGDLALTVTAELPENLGNIVRIGGLVPDAFLKPLAPHKGTEDQAEVDRYAPS